MVKDIAAIKTDGSLEVVPDIRRTAEGLTTYWRHDPNLVVSPSKSTTIADGIEATTYVITISPNGKFLDKGCPVYPRCGDLSRTQGIGAEGAMASGLRGPSAYLATVGTGGESHLFVIGLEGQNMAALTHLAEEAAPIIGSIRLPS